MFYNLWLKSSNELFQRWRHFLRKSCGFGHGRALSLLLLKRERRLLDLLFRLVSMVITDSLSRLFELVFEPRRFSFVFFRYMLVLLLSLLFRSKTLFVFKTLLEQPPCLASIFLSSLTIIYVILAICLDFLFVTGAVLRLFLCTSAQFLFPPVPFQTDSDFSSIFPTFWNKGILA